MIDIALRMHRMPPTMKMFRMIRAANTNATSAPHASDNKWVVRVARCKVFQIMLPGRHCDETKGRIGNKSSGSYSSLSVMPLGAQTPSKFGSYSLAADDASMYP